MSSRAKQKRERRMVTINLEIGEMAWVIRGEAPWKDRWFDLESPQPPGAEQTRRVIRRGQITITEEQLNFLRHKGFRIAETIMKHSTGETRKYESIDQGEQTLILFAAGDLNKNDFPLRTFVTHALVRGARQALEDAAFWQNHVADDLRFEQYAAALRKELPQSQSKAA